MRFKDKRFLDERDVGKTKRTTKFLILPLSINGETRWLEKATYDEIVEMYSREHRIYRWTPQRWIN